MTSKVKINDNVVYAQKGFSLVPLIGKVIWVCGGVVQIKAPSGRLVTRWRDEVIILPKEYGQ